MANQTKRTLAFAPLNCQAKHNTARHGPELKVFLMAEKGCSCDYAACVRDMWLLFLGNLDSSKRTKRVWHLSPSFHSAQRVHCSLIW